MIIERFHELLIRNPQQAGFFIFGNLGTALLKHEEKR